MESKIKLLNDLLRKLGEHFRIEVKIVHKNNETLFGLCLTGGDVAPTVYVDKEKFMSESNNKIIDELRDIYNGTHITFDNAMTSRNFILNNVYPRLVGQANETWVKEDTYIYKKFLDMCVLYYVKLPSDNKDVLSYTLNTEHIKRADISMDEIESYALSNLRDKVVVRSMGDILRGELGFEEGLDFGMHIVTNTWKVNGAAVILLDELLDDLSEMFGDDFVVLPSSIHECIVVPIGVMQDIDILKQMVCDVNESSVEPQDRLTNSVYIYDGTLRIC